MQIERQTNKYEQYEHDRPRQTSYSSKTTNHCITCMFQEVEYLINSDAKA